MARLNQMKTCEMENTYGGSLFYDLFYQIGSMYRTYNHLRESCDMGGGGGGW